MFSMIDEIWNLTWLRVAVAHAVQPILHRMKVLSEVNKYFNAREACLFQLSYVFKERSVKE